jgi:hypothetical protein
MGPLFGFRTSGQCRWQHWTNLYFSGLNVRGAGQKLEGEGSAIWSVPYIGWTEAATLRSAAAGVRFACGSRVRKRFICELILRGGADRRSAAGSLDREKLGSGTFSQKKIEPDPENKKACWRLNQQAFSNPAEVHTELARADAFDQLAADIQYHQQSLVESSRRCGILRKKRSLLSVTSTGSS